MKKSIDILTSLGLSVLIILLFIFNLNLGDVQIEFGQVVDLLMGRKADNPIWSYAVESRLNRSLVAIASGGALAICGLILQVYFRNPLAGPGVLGISSGASLGVAAVILGGVGMSSFLGNVGLISAGLLGALGVLLLLLFLARIIKQAVTLLVVGLMFGYFTASLINVLFQWAGESDTREYVIWGLGSFDGLDGRQGWYYMMALLGCSLITILLIKPLNALILGPEYAKSLGINLKKTRWIIICITGILTAVVTVYCGPIAFIGVAVPQIMRWIVKSKNHFMILPMTFLAGSVLALAADIIVRLSGNSLPLNTVTALIGAPVIVWTIIKMNKGNAQL
ncbi:iron ABC transporter permease [Crocinitomix catalasitica]|nr:iron ABC transporter permease [Crocinitomix catalasitica]